ncbi:hypothetical protein J4E85_008360 [Alternaria conjuncta]|uniref:uncharacterized protein n=1 Tax=Alternaria conjuncta TaxID=181017 RepID=UPI00222119BC|nr:uncharacterized protein J4E85_008360 [Alternaria conjuncta]KAI4923323.1 hypothetical protein J4E85_008360 [Alternaria conjuncta]
MVRTSTAADSQCVHAMVAEDILKFMCGLMVYVWFAMDAFFNMTNENKFPAVLAWLVLIPITLFLLANIVVVHVDAISRKYKLSNDDVTGLQYILGCIYVPVFLSICAAIRFAIPKGHLLVWSSFFLLPVCGMLFALAIDARARGW